MTRKPTILLFSLCLTGTLFSPLPTSAQQKAENTLKPQRIEVSLELSQTALSMENLGKHQIGFRPSSSELVAEKPAFITKEPTYQGTPKYGAFRVGNGPKSITYFATDDQQNRIYVDKKIGRAHV